MKKNLLKTHINHVNFESIKSVVIFIPLTYLMYSVEHSVYGKPHVRIIVTDKDTDLCFL